MLLCLNNPMQSIASSKFKKNAYKKSQTAHWLWKWETWHNTRSSQFIIKFKTEDRQYLLLFSAFSSYNNREDW